MSETKVIEPTIGRKVWYVPALADGDIRTNDETQPLDATIVYVWGTRLVNLQVVDHTGATHVRTSVTLAQPGDDVQKGGRYAQWMPYQVGQAEKSAAKTAAAPAEVADQKPDRVKGDDIEAMVERLRFEYVDRPGGSNVTFCHTFLDGFFVASGLSICVDPLAFDQALGRMNATKNAIQASRDKLWEFEGYVLHCRRQGRFDVNISAPHVTLKVSGHDVTMGGLKSKDAPVAGEDDPVLAEGCTSASSPAANRLRRLRVTNDGLSNLTKVFDVDTGEEVHNVQAIRMEHHVGGGMYAIVETFNRAPQLDVTTDGEVRCVDPAEIAGGPVWGDTLRKRAPLEAR